MIPDTLIDFCCCEGHLSGLHRCPQVDLSNAAHGFSSAPSLLFFISSTMASQFVQRGKTIVAIGRNYVAHIKVSCRSVYPASER